MRKPTWKGVMPFDARTTAEVTGRRKRTVWNVTRREYEQLDVSRWRDGAKWIGIHPRNAARRPRRSTYRED